MVELPVGTAVAVAAGGGALIVLLVLLLVRSFRRGRATSRRLASIAARLELPGAPPLDDRDEVGRLERLAQAAVLQLSDVDARADRLGGALEAVRHGVVVCDEHGQVVFCNEAAVALAGAAGAAGGAGGAGGGTGGAGAELGAAAVREALRAAVAGDAHTGPARTVEVLGPPRRTVRVRGQALDDGRRVVGAVALLEDVSEQRRLEVTRRDFLTNLTAELKAPVGALGLLAGTIVAEDDPALTRRLADRLERDALAVGRLVDDLGELSRLDALAVPPREPVGVDLLVAQAVEEAGAAAPQRAVVIDSGDAPAGLTVLGERRQLVSAVRHLVDNALKYSSQGVRVKVAAGDGWADIAVSDEGAGIPAGELDRVFECFFRGGPTRRSTTAGTGVGLAIVSRVAGGHGGEVVVASEEGKGSTFTLRLPARLQTAPAREREAG